MIRKTNLGVRRVCQVCGTRYYDLNREDVRCPRCGAQPTEEQENDPRLVAMARLRSDGTRRQERTAAPFELDSEADDNSEEDDAEEVDDDLTDESDMTDDFGEEEDY